MLKFLHLIHLKKLREDLENYITPEKASRYIRKKEQIVMEKNLHLMSSMKLQQRCLSYNLNIYNIYNNILIIYNINTPHI